MNLQIIQNVEDTIVDSSIWEQFTSFLNIKLYANDSESVVIKMGSVLLFIGILIVTSFVLRLLKRLITKKLQNEDKAKFGTVFSFSKWFIYIILLLVFLSGLGVNLTGLLAASAGLLLGIGLALQVFFQDIISGIFILIDQSVHVGDIIEIDNKVGRVIEIRLRTTRAVTIDNKVLVIPNHLYLTNSLYNWTQNGTSTRETVSVSVAYGSDVDLVKELLLQAAKDHKDVLQHPAPLVLFTDFADSALDFKLIFTLNDSFNAIVPKSEIRFKINQLFKDHNIRIPFPQRDVHIIEKSLQ